VLFESRDQARSWRESRNHSSPARRMIEGCLRTQLSCKTTRTNSANSTAVALLGNCRGMPVFRNYFLIEEPENQRNLTGVSPELMFECVME